MKWTINVNNNCDASSNEGFFSHCNAIHIQSNLRKWIIFKKLNPTYSNFYSVNTEVPNFLNSLFIKKSL